VQVASFLPSKYSAIPLFYQVSEKFGLSLIAILKSASALESVEAKKSSKAKI